MHSWLEVLIEYADLGDDLCVRNIGVGTYELSIVNDVKYDRDGVSRSLGAIGAK